MRLREMQQISPCTQMQCERQGGIDGNLFTKKDPNPTIATVRKAAEFLDCSPSYLMREIIPKREPPARNQRKRLELMEDTGSEIEKAAYLHAKHGGRMTTEFVAEMDRHNFWDYAQLYLYEEGLYIYGWMGGRQIDYLGSWALRAPGQICGERDPDKSYARWTMKVWQQVINAWKPRRYACLVRNGYPGGPACLEYDVLYAPMLIDDKPHLLMVARVMEGLFDS